MMATLLSIFLGVVGGHLLPRLLRVARPLDLLGLGNTLVGGAGGGFGGALAAALGLAPAGIPTLVAAFLSGAGAVALIGWARNLLGR